MPPVRGGAWARCAPGACRAGSRAPAGARPAVPSPFAPPGRRPPTPAARRRSPRRPSSSAASMARHQPVKPLVVRGGRDTRRVAAAQARKRMCSVATGVASVNVTRAVTVWIPPVALISAANGDFVRVATTRDPREKTTDRMKRPFTAARKPRTQRWPDCVIVVAAERGTVEIRAVPFPRVGPPPVVAPAGGAPARRAPAGRAPAGRRPSSRRRSHTVTR